MLRQERLLQLGPFPGLLAQPVVAFVPLPVVLWRGKETLGPLFYAAALGVLVRLVARLIALGVAGLFLKLHYS